MYQKQFHSTAQTSKQTDEIQKNNNNSSKNKEKSQKKN